MLSTQNVSAFTRRVQGCGPTAISCSVEDILGWTHTPLLVHAIQSSANTMTRCLGRIEPPGAGSDQCSSAQRCQ